MSAAHGELAIFVVALSRLPAQVKTSSQLATILFGWELGSGHGHIQNLLVIARKLVQLGHHPVFAMRDLANMRACLPNRAVSGLASTLLARASATWSDTVPGI